MKQIRKSLRDISELWCTFHSIFQEGISVPIEALIKFHHATILHQLHARDCHHCLGWTNQRGAGIVDFRRTEFAWHSKWCWDVFLYSEYLRASNTKNANSYS